LSCAIQLVEKVTSVTHQKASSKRCFILFRSEIQCRWTLIRTKIGATTVIIYIFCYCWYWLPDTSYQK